MSQPQITFWVTVFFFFHDKNTTFTHFTQERFLSCQYHKKERRVSSFRHSRSSSETPPRPEYLRLVRDWLPKFVSLRVIYENENKETSLIMILLCSSTSRFTLNQVQPSTINNNCPGQTIATVSTTKRDETRHFTVLTSSASLMMFIRVIVVLSTRSEL